MKIGPSFSIFGFSLGTVIAFFLSYTKNKSILLALLHGFLSWFYVIYHFVVSYFSI